MKPEFKILVLEGVECNAELIEYELGKAETHFRVVRLGDRESYCRALQEFGPDLILADCRQKSSEGLIALAHAQEICPETPFLFVSGEMSPAAKKLGMAAAAAPKRPPMRALPKIRSFFTAAGRG